MLLHDARREARVSENGDLVLLEEQDRTRWNREQIEEALRLVAEAMQRPAPYALQAAIAAEHCKATRAEDTDWNQIVRLYEQLEQLDPSPIISLNRAVAVAMAEGPGAALRILDELASSGELKEYHLLYAARADLLRRLGEHREAASNYSQALALVKMSASGFTCNGDCGRCSRRCDLALPG
jgi:RNA polymerase sigma-70 factor (ECF subfamily)